MIAAWMIYAVVASIPIALGAEAVSVLLRRHGLPERGVWVLALLGAVLIPLLALALPASTSEAALNLGIPWLVLDFGVPAVVDVPQTSPLVATARAVLLLWLALSAGLAARLARSLLSVERERRDWKRARLAGTDVRLSSDLGPAVYGLARPEIVIPAWMSELPDDQLELILRHETEHISAGDPWALWAATALRIALPWHPIVWHLTRGLRQALELDCDRRVTKNHGNIGRYGETILAVAARARPPHAEPLAAFTESTRFIKRRLLTMTQPKRVLGRGAVAAIVALTVVVIAGACETPLPTAVPDVDESLTAVPAVKLDVGALAAEPTVTPFTVAPSIRNRDEVVQAMQNEYPALLRDAGIGGSVTIFFFIDADGTVRATRINESSGHPALDDAALEVASVYRFAPALNGDEKVPVWILFRIAF